MTQCKLCARGSDGSQQRGADGADVVFTDTASWRTAGADAYSTKLRAKYQYLCTDSMHHKRI